LKFACSEASLFGMVKTSGAVVLVESPVQSLNVQVEPAVTGIVTLAPSANWFGGHSALPELGVPTVPQPAAMSDSMRHVTKVAVSVTGVAGMVKTSGLLVPV